MTVALRKAGPWAADLLLAWRNENREFFGDASLIEPTAHRRWLDELERTPNDLLFVVCVSGKPVGTIGLRIAEGMAEVRRVLLGDKSYARQGVMSTALGILLDAFGPILYWLHVKADNEGAIAFYVRNGWRVKESPADGWLEMVRP